MASTLILLFLSYSEVTVATRSSLCPDQMVIAVTQIQYVSSPDVGSAPRKDLYSPKRQRRPGQLDEPQRQIPCKDLVSDDHRDKTTGNRWFFCTIWLCCSLELNCWFRLVRGELAPQLSLVSPKVFFSILSLMEFWFLAAVASGLLSWGHFIYSDIVDLIANYCTDTI